MIQLVSSQRKKNPQKISDYTLPKHFWFIFQPQTISSISHGLQCIFYIIILSLISLFLFLINIRECNYTGYKPDTLSLKKKSEKDS